MIRKTGYRAIVTIIPPGSGEMVTADVDAIESPAAVARCACRRWIVQRLVATPSIAPATTSLVQWRSS